MASASEKPLLNLGDIAGRGRALLASRDIKPGEILLTESPLLLYPSPSSSSSSSSSSSPSFCSHCFRRLPAPPIPCPSCPNFFFCSSLCLSSHSPSIRRAISSLPPLPNPHLLSLSHFLLSASSLSSPNLQFLLSLDATGAAGGSHSAPAAEEALLLHSILAPFTRFSLKDTAFLVEIDKRNAFALMEPFREGDGEERRVRAYGIYPKASFFNHDCLPNACRFDYVDRDGVGNTDIVVRAIHEIPEGREVCLSYFPANWGYEERQGRLMEEYGFRCVCDRCEVEKNWKDDDEEDLGDGNDDFPHAYFFVRFVCGKENCGGTLAPLPPLPEGTPSGLMECNVCGELRKEDGFGGDDDGGDDMMLVE